MSRILSILFLCIVCITVSAQYYVRGIITDEAGAPLYNMKIQLVSKKPAVYYSGATGEFGILTATPKDTICIENDGYEVYKKEIHASIYQVISLKAIPGRRNIIKNKLSSYVLNSTGNTTILQSNNDGESYSKLVENHFIKTLDFPESCFSLHNDRASYSNIRRLINMGMQAPPDAVRIDELLNYFNFKTDTILPNKFHLQYQLTDAPWDKHSRLLFMLLQAPKIDVSALPPSNLVFLIDVSGSMDQPNRLPLLQQSFKMLVNNLRAIDSVSIVVYGGSVGIKLHATSGAEKEKIMNVIDKLIAGGDTPGENAIKTAYELAEKSFILNGNNRIILATDGDFNVGQKTDKELETLILKYRQSGIYLTCLGVGMGNYKDSKLETLAKNGNGNFAFIDNVNEGEKVLVQEFSKTLFAVADNAFISMKFNPATVEAYKLIGYANLKENIQAGNTDLEGGVMGSGQSTMFAFVLHPANTLTDSVLASFSLKYKLPNNNQEINNQDHVLNNYLSFNNIIPPYRFAAAVIMFGGLLKQSDDWSGYSWNDLISIAKKNINKNEITQEEFLTMIEKAKKLYDLPKSKRKD